MSSRVEGQPERTMMKPTDPLTCRECGATPESRGDAASSSTLAYTCSLCLVTGYVREKQGAAIPLQGASDSGSEPRINSDDSSRVSMTAQQVGARRGGRPRKHVNDQARPRDARRPGPQEDAWPSDRLPCPRCGVAGVGICSSVASRWSWRSGARSASSCSAASWLSGAGSPVMVTRRLARVREETRMHLELVTRAGGLLELLRLLPFAFGGRAGAHGVRRCGWGSYHRLGVGGN